VTVIETEGLTKRYGSLAALDGLDVTVGRGVTGLVGANGAGKSTLLKILLGLLPATSGTATVLGRDVTVESDVIRGRVGYLPEHDCLPLDVSAGDLMVHLARMSGIPATAARERASDALRHVGLDEARHRPIGGYSTGMRQRVKLAQAIVHDPALVLLDEPTNGLDPAGRDEMLTLVRRIGTEFGIPVLITSHLLGELERICDHVVVLDGGRLLRSESITTLTGETGVLEVEVIGSEAPGLAPARDRFTAALVEHGVRVRGHGALVLAEAVDEHVVDVLRDTAAALDLGLVRMTPHRRRLDEVFTGEEVSGG
jgi:ABC-2 type transport system ATP-binding protein